MIFKGIERLRVGYPSRKFTIDGRLVGDIGEVVAARDYDVILHEKSQPGHDGCTSDGRYVQIKATFKDSLTFVSVPQYYLGFKLYTNGAYEEIFNGPGKIIFERYKHRKNIGVELLSFPIRELSKLSQQVKQDDRIPKRLVKRSEAT